MSEGPLFIPLRGEHFDAFERGDKDTEFRQYGARWNEQTCRPGRQVVLSRGYGKQRRILGRIDRFDVRSPRVVKAYREIYGRRGKAACIRIIVPDDLDPLRLALDELQALYTVLAYVGRDFSAACPQGSIATLSKFYKRLKVAIHERKQTCLMLPYSDS